MYTFFKVNLDGSLSHKELLNNEVELGDFMAQAYGKFATVNVIQDATGRTVTYTDNGAEFVVIKKERA